MNNEGDSLLDPPPFLNPPDSNHRYNLPLFLWTVKTVIIAEFCGLDWRVVDIFRTTDRTLKIPWDSLSALPNLQELCFP